MRARVAAWSSANWVSSLFLGEKTYRIKLHREREDIYPSVHITESIIDCHHGSGGGGGGTKIERNGAVEDQTTVRTVGRTQLHNTRSRSSDVA